jgi:hypothetical protein
LPQVLHRPVEMAAESGRSLGLILATFLLTA